MSTVIQEKSLVARNMAGEKFRNGMNCAEAILHTFNELLDSPLDKSALKMATGLGGGYGHAGCSCGALTGSILILGLFKGRSDSGQDRKEAYSLAREFHDRFKGTFGATCCRSLNKNEFDTPEHLRFCLKLTGNTAKLLTEFLEEKDLLS